VGVERMWRYEYAYAPLMKDLEKGKGKERNEKEEIKEKEQLLYVLPYENLNLLGEKGEEIKEKYGELYPRHYEFKWCFSRYFWEAHPMLPEITIEMLKKMAI